jgi:TfoX/Sxy family transcriptional regulator of competence genes
VTDPDRPVPELFDELAAEYLGLPGVTYGRIWHNEGLKVNNKVFAMLLGGELVVKIPAADAARLIEAGEGVAFEPRPGRRMKEWVVVGQVDRDRWSRLIADAFRYGTALTSADTAR